jgi:hypothetical protein
MKKKAGGRGGREFYRCAKSRPKRKARGRIRLAQICKNCESDDNGNPWMLGKDDAEQKLDWMEA